VKGWAGIDTKDEKEKKSFFLLKIINDTPGQMLSVHHLCVLFRIKIMYHPFGESC